MAQALAANEVQSLIASIAGDLQQPTIFWQVLVVVSAGLLAWAASRWMRPKVAAIQGRWHASAEDIERALFPLYALAFVLIGKAALTGWNPTSLLHLAAALLGAMAIARLAAYLLRSIFNHTKAIDTWGRLITSVVWIGFALHLTGLLPPLVAFLEDVSFPMGKHQISLLLLVRGAFSVALTLLLALWIGRLIEGRLMSADALDLNLRVILNKLIKALLVLIGLLFALSAVGLDLTLLSVFGGALGVGLGFGLQKIASNYVSGFIILADHSVSLGNTVTVDGRDGVVTRMTGRYVVVRSLDGTEALIPNETLITNTLLSHSYSDQQVRVAVPISIGYDSDLDATIELLESIAVAHPRVLAQPAPSVLVIRFGESGIDLELGAWIKDPDAGRGGLRSDLYREIWTAFKAHGISIPFPQREVRLLSSEPPPPALPGAAGGEAPSAPVTPKVNP